MHAQKFKVIFVRPGTTNMPLKRSQAEPEYPFGHSINMQILYHRASLKIIIMDTQTRFEKCGLPLKPVNNDHL